MKANLTYLAWPITLVLAFSAGSMMDNLSNKVGEAKTSRRTNIYADTTARKQTSSSRRSDSKLPSKNIANIEDRKTRLKHLLDRIDTLSENELKEMLEEYLKCQSTKTRFIERTLIVDALLAKDPLATLEYLYEDPDNKHDLLVPALTNLAKYSPELARSWVLETQDLNTYHTRKMMMTVVRGTALTDIHRAMEFVAQIERQGLRYQAVYTIGKELAALPVQDSWKWLNKYAPKYCANLIQAIPIESIPKMVQIIDGVEDSTLRSRYKASLVRNWSSKDQAAMKRWIETQSDREINDLACSAMYRLVESSPTETANWIQQFKDHMNFHKIALTFIRASVRSNPKLAASHLKHIEGQNRMYYREVIYKKWKKLDEAAALRFKEADELLYPSN